MIFLLNLYPRLKLENSVSGTTNQMCQVKYEPATTNRNPIIQRAIGVFEYVKT